MKMHERNAATVLLLALLAPASDARTITELIDATGDGAGNPLNVPYDVAVDRAGSVYLTGFSSDNAFKITPAGMITEIIDAAGDGSGNLLDGPTGMAVDRSGTIYMTGYISNNAFKITPGGTITEIINATGDGEGNTLDGPWDIAVDANDNVYVTGVNSFNVFKITPGGAITEIIDATGDGEGNTLEYPLGIAVDSSSNVYVPGCSNNAFKITPDGVITEIIDATGDGAGHPLSCALDIAVAASGNVYVTGFSSFNAFKITPGGVITEIIDTTGDGAGNPLYSPFGIAADGSANVYVTGVDSDNAFRITSGGVITEIIDATGGGASPLDTPWGIALDGSGRVYVAGVGSHNAFEIEDLVLSIAADTPAAEGGTVDVDIDFMSGGLSIAATAFSVDYDQTCLDFDDTDADPVDGIPDAIELHVPADFSLAVFHDLGDDDGEIDVSMVDFNSPISALPDGPLLTATFTATCSPALGATITAPVVFSTDPEASFSDDLAQDVEGGTSGGSVKIYPGPRGDCNGSGDVSAADLVADGLEIFDDDGSFWVDVPGGTFPGSPVGCDANADTEVEAADVSCTILLIFGGTCGGGGSRPALRPPAVLRIDGTPRLQPGKTIRIPVRFESHGHQVSSLAFSLDLEPLRLRFDPADRDRDGVPDAVRFPAGAPTLTAVRFDRRDKDGELDVLLSLDPGETFEDSVLLEIELEPVRRGRVAKALRFSSTPAASFGGVDGESVPGRTVVDRKVRPQR